VNTAINTTRQRLVILAGVVMALAIGGLVWLMRRRAGLENPVPQEQTGAGVDLAAGADDGGAQRSPQPAHLVDARELLARESTMAGRVTGARKR
jgi:hypothetical protein